MARRDNIRRHIAEHRRARAARREMLGPDMLDTTISIGREVVGATADMSRKAADVTIDTSRRVADTTIDMGRRATSMAIDAGKTISTAVGVWALDIKEKFNEIKNREREPIFGRIKNAVMEKARNIQDRGSRFVKNMRDGVMNFTADVRDVFHDMSSAPVAMEKESYTEVVSDKGLDGDAQATPDRIDMVDAVGALKKNAKRVVEDDEVNDFARYYFENRKEAQEGAETMLGRLDDKAKSDKVTAGQYARSLGIATFWSTLKNKQPLPETTAEGVVKDIDRHALLETQLAELEKLKGLITEEMTGIEDKYGLVSAEVREEKAFAEFTESGKRYAEAQYNTALQNGASEEELEVLRNNLNFTEQITEPQLVRDDSDDKIVYPPLVEAELARFAQMYHDTEYKSSIMSGVAAYDENFVSDEGVSKALYMQVMDDIDHGKLGKYGVGEKTLEERTDDVERLRNAQMSDEDFEEFHKEGKKHFADVVAPVVTGDALAYYNPELGVKDNYTVTPEDIEENERREQEAFDEQYRQDALDAEELENSMYELDAPQYDDSYYDQEVPPEFDDYAYQM
jgi:hypothetical protein